MNFSEYTGIIAGSGIAGLYAALKFSEIQDENIKILLVTKSEIQESNSKYAQGGIVGVMAENIADNTDLHVKDTLKAGDGLSDEAVVKFISENSETAIRDLIKHGVDFDKDENINLKYTLEGAHSVKRILHCGGDATGLGIEKVLARRVKEKKNIEIQENTIIADLLTNEKGECSGIITFDEKNGEYNAIQSNIVILATGGAGQLYKHTTNPDVTTGDGMAVAYRAGALMQDMEFIQFHPTALKDKFSENMFLISEAVRGEGAKLVDRNKKTFMEKYDPRLELASRDIVTRAIYNELSETGEENVFLNATVIDEEKFKKRFPTISGVCKKNGINPSKDLIPVSPAAHYIMGGIKADVDGKTSIKNLFAIGEVSCTGLHGANRLASNSLLECVVSGYSVIRYIKNNEIYKKSCPFIKNDKNILEIIRKYEEKADEKPINVKELKQQLKEIMWTKAGIIRNEADLFSALKEIEAIDRQFGYSDKCPSGEAYELRNLITVAKMVTEFAAERKESRGGHFRSDYPQKSDKTVHSVKSITK